MNNLGKLIKFYRKKRRVDQSSLAQKLDISIQSLSRLENDKVKIHTGKVEEICHILDVNVDEFWRKAMGQEGGRDNHEIPIVGHVNTSSNKNNVTWSQEWFPTNTPMGFVHTLSNLLHTRYYGLVINDNSMDPFLSGWVVVADPDDTVINKNNVIVLHNGRLLFRRINIIDKNTFYLEVFKSFEEPLKLNKDEVPFIHKAWCYIDIKQDELYNLRLDA
ncbi:MAG: LexA family transcriptional regulator [Deltaproteobacteria bacterium]|nr:LexA family transcriptional regulator [Deltaproteobacteria bacterium]